jgi:alpha-glucosidase
MATSNQDWWRGATIYQIYPRSFSDSDGDGIGDLRGITLHLDYVASLGVDGVWISPFYPSPMRDFGYDVQNYRDVDPMFGTLQDFDDLVARAHTLGLKVIIDQVWSHTALEHPWFEESRQSRDNPKSDWYVWADAKPDGSPPSNWQSWMGGPTWTWDMRRQQYYLHNFLPQMPDLNLHCVAVQDALLNVGRFWLERGVDGFRLDTANYYCHDRSLTDNPPQPLERRGDLPASMQQHLHNICQPETLHFLERVRQLTDGFDARMTVAEIGSANNLERMLQYTQGRQRLHTAYSFVLLGDQPQPWELADLMRPWQEGAQDHSSWPSWALSNHDAQRVATRWAKGDAARARQLLALLACLRGTLFLYQGEELGLEQSAVAYELIQDPVGKVNWPRNVGRDGCRTPMPWQADAANAGFTTGHPWLPLDAAQMARCVDVQESDTESCLQLTRRLLSLRRTHRSMRTGRFEVLQADDRVLVVLRHDEDDAVLCAFNLCAETSMVSLPRTFTTGAQALTLGRVVHVERQLLLGPWAALVSPVASATDRDAD